jgi:hypothetical protein
MVLCKAVSQPPLKSGSTILGKSGYRKIEIWSNLTPEANNSLYMMDVVSIAWWTNIPALSITAIIPKETTPAPPMANATGNPDNIPPKRQTNTIIKPISTPSRPNNITTVPNY